MPLFSSNITIVGQGKISSPDVKPIIAPVNNSFFEKIKQEKNPPVKKTLANIVPANRPKIDPDHELLNIGGKVDRQHSTYLVDMLT